MILVKKIIALLAAIMLLLSACSSATLDGAGKELEDNGKIDDGSQVNLEMQASYMVEDLDGQHRNLKGKSVYYLTDLHSSQPAKGLRRYDRLARSYQITFCSYTIFPNTQDYVNSFSMRHNVTGELLSDAISVTFVELSKLGEVVKKPVSDMTALDKWSVFFQYAPDLEHREIVNKVIESEEVLQVAGNLLMSISKNERERAIYRSRRKFQTDRQSDLATAEDNGKQIGRAEEKIEIARNALQMKMTVADIVRLTGLTQAEVENLCKEI